MTYLRRYSQGNKLNLLYRHVNLILTTLIGAVAISACSRPATTSVEPLSRSTITRPTPYNGPFPTPSGPLLSALRNDVANRFAHKPQMVGPFVLLIPPQINYDSPIGLSFKHIDGAEYRLIIDFSSSFESIYVDYRDIIPLLPDGQQVQIGDEALVSAQAGPYLAVMRYRNVLAYIQTPTKPETIRTALTNEQIVAVLKDIYEQLLLKP